MTAWAVRHPRRVLAITALAMVAAALLANARLGFRTSNLDLVDQRLPEVQRFLAFAREFGTPNMLVLVFDGAPPEALRESVIAVGQNIRAVSGVRTVLDEVPIPADLEEWASDRDRFLTSRDGKQYYLFVQPLDHTTSVAALDPFVHDVKQAVAEVGLQPGVRVGYTGLPIYALDDRDVIQHDVTYLSLLSFALVFGIFAVGFRRVARPLLATVCLMVIVVVTLGLTSLYPGHLTLFSASFASIISGLGIDYGIHLINRVEELLAEGLAEREALPRAVVDVGRGIVTGALTTAAVFFIMVVSGFRGFAELGIVAGMGVLVSLVTMLVVLPALLAVVPCGAPAARRTRWIDGLLAALRSKVGLCLAVIVVGLAMIGRQPTFDTDYLNLQPEHSKTVALERQMVANSDFSTQFGAFVVASRREAVALAEKLREDPTVADARTIADLETVLPFGHSLAEFPPEFVHAFKSPAGRYAVYVYPRGNAWEPAVQAAFVDHMRAISPDVTGMPFLGRFMMARSWAALQRTALLGGLLIVCLVTIDLRRPTRIVLAILPTVLTMACLHGFMRWLDLAYNPIDIMALPLIIGISVDNGVHVVHRFLAERGDVLRTVRGTGRSIVLTSLTTLAAFASLALTRHRGMHDFALELCLGVATSLVLSAGLLPWLLSRMRDQVLRDARHA